LPGIGREVCSTGEGSEQTIGQRMLSVPGAEVATEFLRGRWSTRGRAWSLGQGLGRNASTLVVHRSRSGRSRSSRKPAREGFPVQFVVDHGFYFCNLHSSKERSYKVLMSALLRNRPGKSYSVTVHLRGRGFDRPGIVSFKNALRILAGSLGGLQEQSSPLSITFRFPHRRCADLFLKKLKESKVGAGAYPAYY